MKILYLSYDGLTDALGQSQILAYQNQISCPTTKVFILSFEKRKAYEAFGEKLRQTCIAHHIHWHPLFYTKNPPVLSTLLDLIKAWILILELQRQHHFDIVHCRGYVSALLGEKMKKKFGTRFIFDMRGWWPDEKKESGSWSNPLFNTVYGFFKKKEKSFFRHSDLTISLTESGKREIIKNGWKDETNIRVISTCTDLTLFKPLNDTQRLKTKIEAGFPLSAKVLVYSGAIGGNYPLAELLLFINSFLSLSPSHHCLILSKDHNLGNISVPERTKILSVNYSEVSNYLSFCDLGFIFYKPAFSNIGRCPTKLGEYWACGLPVICPTQIGDLDILFAKHPQCGYTIPWTLGDITALLTQFPYETDSSSIKELAFHYFSLEIGIRFYKEVYLELANRS